MFIRKTFTHQDKPKNIQPLQANWIQFKIRGKLSKSKRRFSSHPALQFNICFHVIWETLNVPTSKAIFSDLSIDVRVHYQRFRLTSEFTSKDSGVHKYDCKIGQSCEDNQMNPWPRLQHSSSDMGTPLLNKLLPKEIELSNLDCLPYGTEKTKIMMGIVSAE